MRPMLLPVCNRPLKLLPPPLPPHPPPPPPQPLLLPLLLTPVPRLNWLMQRPQLVERRNHLQHHLPRPPVLPLPPSCNHPQPPQPPPVPPPQPPPVPPPQPPVPPLPQVEPPS